MYNKQLLEGYVGKEPEIVTFADGSKEAKFTVAVTKRGFTTSTGKEIPEHTEWFNCVVKGNKADYVEKYLHKGDRVFCDGETYTNEYTDAQGIRKRFTEVRVSELSGFPRQANPTGANTNPNPAQGYGQPQQSYQPKQQSFGFDQPEMPF